MISEHLYLWVAFNIFVVGTLALDLTVFHRKAHAVSLREALAWSVVWIVLALLFNGGVYYFWGQEKALEFLTGYLIEKALSVDNLFVFIVIFSYFSVPAMYHHRVLFWGILGALVMRAVFIAAGVALIHAFHWMIYVFGGFLIVTGIKMLFAGDEKVHPERNPLLRLLRRLIPVTKEYHGQRFFVRIQGRLWATPLLLVLVVVESTDVIFAVDSIPAILAITTDPFIVYSSNVFAILGLRALYFLLAGILDRFHYLKAGLSLVLCFVGTKMMLVDLYKIPIGLSLGIVAGILAVSMLASLNFSGERAGAARSELPLRWRALMVHNLHYRVRAWVWLAVVFAVAGAVKWASIRTGVSARSAITVVRLAERDWAEARWRDDGLASARRGDAEAALREAWAALGDKRYEDTIRAAHKARETLRDLL